MMYLFVSTAFLQLAPSHGHAQMTWPPSRQHFGSLEKAGACNHLECEWTSHGVTIPGEPSLNEADRTTNVEVSSGPSDWSRKNPWRAPGTAPVFGSGCGVAAGRPHQPSAIVEETAGMYDPWGYAAGTDASFIDSWQQEPTVWHSGGIEEVAWAIHINHGGGYSWRLCPKDGEINEECFQRNVLRFAGDKQWIQYGNLTVDTPVPRVGDEMPVGGEALRLPRFEIPLHLVTEGTHPSGSHWARNPIPECKICDFAPYANITDEEEKHKYLAGCHGGNMLACPPGMTQFPEPLSGLSGQMPMWVNNLPPTPGVWGRSIGFPFSIVDRVIVPDLPAGDYLLSWRWDVEQTPQVWQNCADIRIVVEDSKTPNLRGRGPA